MKEIPMIERRSIRFYLLAMLLALPLGGMRVWEASVSAQIQIPNPPPLLVYPNPQSVLLGNTLIVKPSLGPTDNGGIGSVVVQQITPSGFTGTVTVDSLGKVTISNAGPVGAYTIVIRATDTGGQSTPARFSLRVSSEPCLSYHEAAFSPFLVPGGGNTQDIVTADFNNDGHLDLAVSKSFWDQLTIMLGNGNGQFALAPGSPIDNPNAGSLEAVDINRDGKIDLVTLETNAVSVLIGDGSGGFTKSLPFATPASGTSFFDFTVNDFNTDGRPDVAITESGGNLISIRIFLNLPLLGLSEVTAVPVLNQLFGIKSADFNNDGHPDLVVETIQYNPTFSQARIFYGNGSGGFAPNLLAPVITGELFSVGDYNNDGNEDLLVISGNLLQTYLGDGMTGFNLAPGATTVSASAEPINASAIDFNLDGARDLINGFVYATTISKHQNIGGGAFSSILGEPVINKSKLSPLSVDVNGDGKVDIIAAASDGYVYVYLHGGCGPSITPAAPLERSTCSPGSVSTIATVSDDDYPAGQLTVSVVSASAGLSVTGITNLNGVVTALVAADPNTAPGAKSVNLKVTNPLLRTDVGTLTVNVVLDAQPLTLSQPQNLTVGAAPDQCSAVVNYPLPAASGGGCGATVTTVCTPGPGFAFPLGTTTVNCTATDGLGGQAGTSFEVTVLDYQAPTFTNLTNLVVNAAPGECSAVVDYDIQAFDGCSAVVVTTDPPSGSVFPAGVTTVTAMVTDAAGNTALGTFTVTVNGSCCGAPTIDTATVTPSVLWPPDHGMRDVTVDYAVTAGCGGPVTCTLSVASNEPVNGLGDGDTAPDWEIIDAHHLRLRAERSGTGSGRIYTITITCTNPAGLSAARTVTVSVRHSR